MSSSKVDDDASVQTDSTSHSKSKTKSTMIPEGLLPSYFATAFGELYEEDGLLVMARGLGWISLLASFCRFYADVEDGHMSMMATSEQDLGLEDSKHHHSDGKKGKMDSPSSPLPSKSSVSTSTSPLLSSVKPPLVLVLGLKDTEQSSLMSVLDSWGTPHAMMPKLITNESGQGKDRIQDYSKGGIFCVTSRILIVDLLTHVLPCQSIDGILVAHGHNVTSESTEAFILRIYTSQKRRDQSFIKAFSDSPEGLLSGFSKIDKTLKALQVRRLYLYPRFHQVVQEELEPFAPHVEELQQRLSPSMKEIQNAIVAALQTCLRELKAATAALVEWSGDALAIENCAMPTFHRTVKRQLEKDWHRIRPQTRQLVEDLRVLGTLFHSLIQADCVKFWSLLNNIKTNSAGSRYPSMWLLTPSADQLFRKAKERIYKIIPGKRTARNPNPVSKLQPILEENPKWRLLRNVLSEIRDKEAKRKMEKQKTQRFHEPVTILVLVKDASSVRNLRNYLVEGRDRALASKFLDYLKAYNDRTRSIASSARLSEESRLLHEEESRVRKVLYANRRIDNQKAQEHLKSSTSSNTSAISSVNTKKRSTNNAVPDYKRKRRRVALERGRGEIMGGLEDRERRAVLDEAIDQADHELESSEFVVDVNSSLAEGGADIEKDDHIYNTMFQASYIDETRVVIRSFAAFEGDPALVLADLDPMYVIMFDMDVALVRSIEVFAAMNGGISGNDFDRRLTLYLLSFDASAEQKVFHKSLEREQSAFVRLIQHKQTMPPPVLQVEGTQEMQVATGVVNTYANGSLPLSMDTRRGQGKVSLGSERRDIAVDVREFRSALPSILHQGGMRLAPVTLTVGDFVLSSVHCIERKSISDLYGSFASGRLYNQADAMSKYYKVPALLIEFDPSKAFCLQNANDLGVDIRNNSITSNMVHLTQSFPKLRILWSKSPHETLHIFRDLKVNHDEVNIEKAVEIGRSDSLEALLVPQINSQSQSNNGEDDEEDEINEAGRDMLLRLPGITIHNARRIMNECDSISDLICLSRMELRKLAGPVGGQKLFTFFHQPYATTT